MDPKAVRRMAVNGPTELSSRPERSGVEGPAVSFRLSRGHGKAARQTSAQTRGGSSRFVHLFTKTFLSPVRRGAKRFVFGSLRVGGQKEEVRMITLLTTYDQGCNTPSTLETST